MPFTPLHVGPGLFIKALLQGSFSLMIFGWTQILMDIQPLLVMITGEGHLQGFSHTYLGASLIAVLAALTGKHLSEYGLNRLAMVRDNGLRIRWWVAFASAFIGSFSHVILDAIMHTDVQPFYPFFTDNRLQGFMSIPALHKLCLYSGLVGAGLYFVVRWFLRYRRRRPE
ncbi:MAG: metal-dependent hydrolase [Pseudomonadota bacterium]|nr:metal-dependent hydrolase [Pseudomonadota bacterium]